MWSYLTPIVVSVGVLFLGGVIYFVLRHLLKDRYNVPARLKIIFAIVVFLLSVVAFLVNSPLAGQLSEINKKILSYILFLILAFSAYLIIEIIDIFLVDYYLVAVKKIYISSPLRRIIFLIVYVFILIILLHTVVKINLLALVAIPTVMTAGVALALQDTLKKLLAGIVLGNVIKVGDWVRLAGHDGCVVELTWARVTIKTFNGDYVMLPTNNVVASEIYKYTASGAHRCTVNIGVAYDIPPQKVKETLINITQNIKGILKNPSPVVYTTSYSDFAIMYTLTFWISDFAFKIDIVDEVYTQIWYAFKKENIEIPFPTRTIIQKNTKPS